MRPECVIGDGITLRDTGRGSWLVTEGSNQSEVTKDNPPLYNLLCELYEKAWEE